MTLNRVGIFVVGMLAIAPSAKASRHCSLDLDALVTVHSGLSVQPEPEGEPWPDSVTVSSDLHVTKGGATSIMRTDTVFDRRPSPVFVSGRLSSHLLAAVVRAIAAVGPEDLVECYVESDPVPATGESTRGSRFITVYRPFAATLWRVEYSSPSDTLLPHCSAAAERLERAVALAESGALEGGLSRLQCIR